MILFGTMSCYDTVISPGIRVAAVFFLEGVS